MPTNPSITIPSALPATSLPKGLSIYIHNKGCWESITG